jgi:hypothetical protein
MAEFSQDSGSRENLVEKEPEIYPVCYLDYVGSGSGRLSAEIAAFSASA